jgi:predicted kinase
MATVHLVHGFVGCGKTTFSKKLATELPAVRFSSDEWMISLFGNNPDPSFFEKYAHLIHNLIWQTATQLIQNGHDVILDQGFWKKTERETYKKLAHAIGADVKLYNLVASEATIKQRVLARTAAQEYGAFIIDLNAIEVFKDRFEPVTADEQAMTIKTD